MYCKRHTDYVKFSKTALDTINQIKAKCPYSRKLMEFGDSKV